MTEINIDLPNVFIPLITKKKRYKVLKGGRGSAKSESIARALIVKMMEEPLRVLCTREYQNSIGDSVHYLLKQIIGTYKLNSYFEITEKTIRHLNGGEFIFKGLQKIDTIKSLQAVDICWIEEAAKVSKRNWEVLPPTIRKNGSEIWLSFNPELEDDPTYAMFCSGKEDNYETEDTLLITANYTDNPFFTEALELERKKCERDRPDVYDHIWKGETFSRTEAQVFIDKWEVRDFETPPPSECTWGRYFYGADWGFSSHPTAAVRCFVKDDCLWIDYEAYGHQIDLDDIPDLFSSIPDYTKWEIGADCARPETISYLKRAGKNSKGEDRPPLRLYSADKWGGSVEDGIEYIRNFRKIYIHTRCKEMKNEARKYCYKVDKVTEKVLPVLVKENDHLWDALRYALDKYIKHKVTSLDVL